MTTSFYVHSLIQILHFVSDDLVQCDAATTVGELFGDEFDDLDFELALTCFEATHKVGFKDSFWEVEMDDYEEMSLEEFIEEYLDPKEQTDPLFVTKRLLYYEKSLSDVLREEYEGPDPELES
jgi:hypothetical protein